MKYINIILSLFKELRNFPLFLYHICHYLNINLPKEISISIRTRNVKFYNQEGVTDILIETIDGGGQVVHPDIDIYGERIAFIGTPYPYAMEEYENPCLYVGNDLTTLAHVACPLDVQQKHTQGVHLSDPCIAADGKMLLCVYRDTRKKDDYIYLKSVSQKDNGGYVISERTLLLESHNRYILSPAIILKGDNMFMYHVETDRITSRLEINIFERKLYTKTEQRSANLINEPAGYYLWHIGIAVSGNYGKKMSDPDTLEGLFLYAACNKKGTFKLFNASSSNGVDWIVGKEIAVPDYLDGIIKFPYKSCFNPQTKKILLSFRDQKDRNRLVEIDNIK